jgi:hypothetical protein
MVMCLKLKLLCGNRGPFLVAAAMVMGVLLGVGRGAYISANPTIVGIYLRNGIFLVYTI